MNISHVAQLATRHISAFVEEVQMDRRKKPRVSDPFPATVMGINKNGDAFEVETVVENLSSSGTFLRLPEVVEPGQDLSIVIRMARLPPEVDQMQLVTHGSVVRAEVDCSGMCGVAVEFISRLLL